MITGPDPFKVVKTGWHKWFCEGPYQSGKEWDTEDEALEEAALLNSVYNIGYFANVDQARLARLEDNAAHAYRCAQEYVPDYPWPDKPDMSCQASTAVWACGESYKGVSAACQDWQDLFEHLAPEAYKALFERIKADTKAYDALLQEIKDKKAKG